MSVAERLIISDKREAMMLQKKSEQGYQQVIEKIAMKTLVYGEKR